MHPRRIPKVPEGEQLDGLALQALAHWKEFRPKMYRQMKKSGSLYEAARNASQQTQEAINTLVERGMDPYEAWMAVREEWIYLPSEEDLPELGGRLYEKSGRRNP